MKKARSIKKPGVNIDMTPLVDVIMLLLTFFMLVATFKAESTEAIEVTLPESVVTDTTKLPEKDIMTLTLTKAGDVFVDVDSYKVKEEVFGSSIGIGLYHPDSTSKSEYELTGGSINGKPFKRPVTMLNKEEFEKTLNDLRMTLKSQNGMSSDFRIVLKGDMETNFGVVEDLMESFKTTRNTRFALVTDVKSDQPDN
ncbi:MAG TPA: biopolymer transporter ExbD [Ignavibacteria bacterium]|nr:biopolymer transporter ExbD [Ignavibacteria bacterium]HQY53253.1 biopolymer transporter ExbD [Ignavibacteria bacterium]HRB01339.1 biopolymer transporter ExbD [Ignavibacteria bacterium]